MQDWLVDFGQRLAKHLPVAQMLRMGWSLLFPPKTQSWGRTGEVLRQYVREQKEAARG